MRALFPSVKRAYFYPKTARRLNLQGRVLVTLVVDASGRVVDVKLRKSCGESMLDDAALESLARLRKVPAPPKAIMAGKTTLEITVPMNYSMRERTS